jgi:hypothetical protein
MNRSSRHSRLPAMTKAMKNVVWLVVALALAAGILVGSAAAGSPSSTPAPLPSSTTVASPDVSAAPEWLSAIAADVASQNAFVAGQTAETAGSVGVTDSEWALCSVKAAAPLMGASAGEVPDDVVSTQCYVIVLKGHFTATMASVPKGRPAPEGNVIVCVVDPGTHKVMGFCLWPEDLKVDTSSVSTLAPLPLQAD